MATLTRHLVDLIDTKSVGEADLEASTLFLLDAAANIVAGQQSDAGRKICDWAKAIGLTQPGANRDTGRLAFVYGALCHILEMDDLHRASVVHPGCVVAPVIFSLGVKADGVKSVKAFLRGVEATTRVGMSVGTEHYKVWHNTATCGPFGSAIAAGFLLNLDRDQMVHALGNAGSQSAGLWQFLQSGAQTKHLHAGRGAETGVVAAQLAQQGFTGAADILEGNCGFYAATCKNPPIENLLANPDGNWQMHLNSIKPWPSCRHTHPAIAIAVDLHWQLAANLQDIKQIVVKTYQATIDLCDRPAPQSVYAAKFSLQHCLATALMTGKADLTSFDETARNNAQPLAEKIALQTDRDIQAAYPQHWGCHIRIEFANGDVMEKSVTDALGDPESPLTRDQLIAKADDLLTHAGATDKNRLIDQVLDMPNSGKVPDLSRYIRCFTN